MLDELVFLLSQHDNPNIRELATAIINGDDCWFALHDAMIEAGMEGIL